MPVIGIQTDLLQGRLGVPLQRDLLVRQLMHLGCDVEGYATLRRFRCKRCANLAEITETQDPPVACERCGVDYREEPALLEAAGEVDVLRMELLAVRPDMFDPGGLARVLRCTLGHDSGLKEYPLAPPRLTVAVDPAVLGDECPRPAIACAVVRNVTLDDDLIKVVMKLQENLHWALGRDRKHASIGVYDLDTIDTSMPLRYRAVGPEELRFVPLGYDPASPDAALTPRQILAEHPKGVGFARLLEGWKRYPLLQDGAGGVLSLPPIINSEQTRVHLGTRSFFIDVTGTGRRIVSKTLNVLVTSLMELAPAVQLEAVNISYPDDATVTPDLQPQTVRLDVARTRRLLGIDELDEAQVATLLGRMGHAVEAAGDGQLTVRVPAYRNDILHPRDLMEDVAIAYGYHNITPRMVPTLTVGSPQPVEQQSLLAGEALSGLGFQEVMTLQLTSPEVTFDAMGLPRGDEHVVIDNPISVEETMVRVSLLPGLLRTLQKNTRRELPQRIFEVGDVCRLDADAETGATERRHLAAALTSATAGFADLRPVLEAVLAELGWELRTEPLVYGAYLPGRSAQVVALRGEERRVVGTLGELHPEVLDRFRLRHPTAAFELELGPLL